LGTNNKAITVKRKLDWLSRCYEYHKLENPWQKIKVKVPAKPMPIPFSEEEVQKIILLLHYERNVSFNTQKFPLKLEN